MTMEFTKNVNLQQIISKSLKISISYAKYRAEVADLVANNSTSGNDKSEELIDYTMLNDRRMKRWDKTIKISDEVKDKLSKFKGNVTWLVLTESWCGDAAHVIPVINKIAELSENIDLKLVYRDENEALMNEFLTNGGKSVPKLIMIDNTSNEVVGTFGPRPQEATQLVLDFKAKHGMITPEIKEDLQNWYNANKGEEVIKELLTLLKL